MIVKTLEDVTDTKGEAHGDKWHSMRLLHAEDGMGVTLTDSILEAGFEMDLWQEPLRGMLLHGRRRNGRRTR
jgi:L-ectoine synthase